MKLESFTCWKFGALFEKEVAELFASRSFWVMLLFLSPLVGFSFIEAAHIYSAASTTTLGDEILLNSLSPLEGLVMPTCSALYLSETFFLPFVAIRILGVEKQFGSLKLLLQLSPQMYLPIAVKALVVLFAFGATLIPVISALTIWSQQGGYLYTPEVATLFFGHLLYAIAIIAISFLAVAITDSPQTAAIVALAFTITSWVIEFAGQNQANFKALSWLSLSANLRAFENGMFSLPTTLGFILVSVFFLILTAIWIRSGQPLLAKLRETTICALIISLLAFCASNAFYFRDFSENRINSFNPKNEAQLLKLNKPLKIIVHLSPEHSAAVDFERNFVSKLRRVVKNFQVVYITPDDSGKFGEGDPLFGEIDYDYDGARMMTHDVGAIKGLEILHLLTGVSLEGELKSSYPGHPHHIDVEKYKIWFYAILPLLIVLSWVLAQNFLKKRYKGELNVAN